MTKKIQFRYEVDSEIHSWLSHVPGPEDPLCNEPVAQDLFRQAGQEAMESDSGRELREILAASGRPQDFFTDRIIYEIGKRWGHSTLLPGIPTRVRIEEILGDLVSELRPLLPQSEPMPSPKRVNLSQEEPLSKETAFVAHCINYMLPNMPASALQPRLGQVRLTDDGEKYYTYSLPEYERHVHEIIRRKIPTVYPLQTSIQRSY